MNVAAPRWQGRAAVGDEMTAFWHGFLGRGPERIRPMMVEDLVIIAGFGVFSADGKQPTTRAHGGRGRLGTPGHPHRERGVDGRLLSRPRLGRRTVMWAGIIDQRGPARAVLGRLFHVIQHHANATRATGAQKHGITRGPSVPTPPVPREAPARVSGVILHEEVPLLARYGTSYGLFDEWIFDYSCVLVSDFYRLGEYVGDSVWVSGPLRGVIEGMPVVEVEHLELLKMKWMR